MNGSIGNVDNLNDLVEALYSESAIAKIWGIANKALDKVRIMKPVSRKVTKLTRQYSPVLQVSFLSTRSLVEPNISTENQISGRQGSFLAAYTSYLKDRESILIPSLLQCPPEFNSCRIQYSFRMHANGGRLTFIKMPHSQQLMTSVS